MARFWILGVAGLAVALLTVNVMAGRGGAARGGMRGAAVGQMVGGDSAAKAGAVIGATRGAMDKETTRRAQYENTAEYQNAQHSNFNEAPPEVFVPAPATGSAVKGGEAIIRKDGKPVVGITFPSDWKQKAGDRHISAISGDGHAWAVIATLEGVKSPEDGIANVKKGFEKYLKEVKYDDVTKSKGGALVITGTGKSMKSGISVVFAAGVVDSGAGPLAGAAFVVDKNLEDHYKETVGYMCQSIRRANDFKK